MYVALSMNMEKNTIQGNARGGIYYMYVSREVYRAVLSDARCDSELIRSTTMGILMACPHLDLAPLMAWMEERRRENARRQRSQHRVWL